MAGSGDRGVSRRAERIEMMKRKTAEGYLYETDILELTDAPCSHPRTLTLITNSFGNLSNPLLKNGRIFSRPIAR